MNAAVKTAPDTDLGCFNARVRGMRGALFKRQDYELFMALPSAEALIERLRSTRYGPHIDAASMRTKTGLDGLQFALATELSASLAFLWKIAPEEARPLLRAICSHWEVFDLKTLIRGIAREVRREEIKAALIPAGEFGSAALDELLASKDIPDLVSFLETWASPYARVLRPKLAEYRRSGRITGMELGADLSANAFLLEALRQGPPGEALMRAWLAEKSDFQNALTLLKIAGEGYSPEAASGFFMEGGAFLGRERFMKLAALKDRDELASALAVYGGRAVKKALDASGADPVLMEEAAEDALKERFRLLSITDPLSIAVGASYVYMKIREVKNLRLIGRGLAFGVPAGELRLFLFFPV